LKTPLCILLFISLMGCGRTPANPRQAPTPVKLSQSVDGWSVSTRHCDVRASRLEPDWIEPVVPVVDAVIDHLSTRWPASPKRIRVFYVHSVSDWRRLIVDLTGDDARTFLQITNGGFAYRDFVALRYLGSTNTSTVAAHEIVHGYVANHFASRPPPLLEEGLACSYESTQLANGRARIDTTRNANRLSRLGSLVRADRLPDVTGLLSSHAGEFLSSQGSIDQFYAVAWSFWQFTQSDPARAAAIDRLMRDARDGRLPARSGLELVCDYLKLTPDEIDLQYRRFVSTITAAGE
jgi:hypothetical protein